MNEDLTTFDGTRAAVWRRLVEAATDARSPYRIIALATQAHSGGGSVRMVVLREAEQAGQTLSFYTHSQSAKVEDLHQCPGAEALYWDRESKFQIRLRGDVNITDGPAEIWEAFGAGTRQNYAAHPAAGDPISRPGEIGGGPDPTMFVMLTLEIDQIETLWLGGAAHHRALFTNESANWLSP